MRNPIKQIGFTLIEVLVGMAIIAVSLAAASRAAGHAIETSNTLKRRVISDIVAENHLELHKAQHDWLTPGKATGQEAQAGMVMVWKESVTETPNPAFRKIVVEVSAAEEPDYQLRRLVGFLTLEPPKNEYNETKK